MFARNVAISLKPNALAEFTQKLKNEVVTFCASNTDSAMKSFF